MADEERVQANKEIRIAIIRIEAPGLMGGNVRAVIPKFHSVVCLDTVKICN